MLSIALALAVFAVPPGLASAPFAQLPTHGAAAQINWSWPGQEAFLATLEASIQPRRVLGGPLFMLADKGVGRRFEKAVAEGKAEALLTQLQAKAKDPSQIVPFGVVSWSPTRGEAVLDNLDWGSGLEEGVPTVHRIGSRTVLSWKDMVVAVEGELAPEVAPGRSAAHTAWAYATTLLLSEPPVYDEKVDHEWATGEKIGELRQAGKKQEALALYRSFRPMGRCSMDSAPAETARSYADLCYEVGQIGCFLQLQVRIMGDRFDRAVWSSYGERAAMTQSSALVEAGVDAERFLLGLLVDYDTALRPRENMNLWRLARSMKELGLDFSATLQALAADPALDAYNRHRAAMTLWLLWRRAEEQPLEAVAGKLKGLDLLPLSRAWMTAVEKKNDPEGAEKIILFE